MLNRLLQFLLISTYNRRRDAKLKGTSPPPPPPVEVPPDYTILGNVISWPEAEKADPVEKRLSDRGIVTLSPDARKRHVYILGATGTGKTNLIMRMVESDIKAQRAFCVFDLRGDMIDRILLRLADAAPPEKWKDRLLLMDLRDTKRVVGFNPLAGNENGSGKEDRSGEDVYSRVMLTLAILKQQSESWGTQFPETLRNSLFALAQSNWTLLEVEPLLTNDAFRAQVLSNVRDTQVRGFFDRYNAMDKKSQVAFAQPVLNKITPLLAIPSVRNMLGQRHSVSFRALTDQHPGMTVLVALDVDRLHDAAQLVGGLILSSFQSAIMSRADQPESERVPVQLYVDEFENLASERFQMIIAEGRRFGLGLTLSHQNISQLSPDMRHLLRNNVHTQAYFQTGAQDASELIKEIGGKNKEEVRECLMSQKTGQAFLVRRGQSPTRMQVKLSPDPKITPEQLQALRDASAQTYARPASEIQDELEARYNELCSTSTTKSSAAGTKGSDGSSGASSPVYEIRHSKTTNFAPGGKTRKPPVDTNENATEVSKPATKPKADSKTKAVTTPKTTKGASAKSTTPKSRTGTKKSAVKKEGKGEENSQKGSDTSESP